MSLHLSRRAVLSATTLAVVMPRVGAASGAGFSYEVVRSDAEWRALLGDATYHVMREGGTEPPHSSGLIKETAAGSYACKGCDLPLYDSRWKRDVDKGWVFFAQSEPDAMLMSIEQTVPDNAVEVSAEERVLLDDAAATEVHCRRCGSHIGHIVIVDGAMLHCSNGSAMTFEPSSA